MEDLYTIRPQEPVFDNVVGKIVLAAADIVKIRSQPDKTACIYFETDPNLCTIYNQRPMECQVLECWNPEKTNTIYQCSRLSRRDLLLPEKPWLWDLVKEHEKRCSYSQVAKLAASWLEKRHRQTEQGLLDIMRYDISLRQTCKEEGGIDPAMLNFLFGLPVSVTIVRFGLNLARIQKGKYRLMARKQNT